MKIPKFKSVSGSILIDLIFVAIVVYLIYKSAYYVTVKAKECTFSGGTFIYKDFKGKNRDLT